MSLTIALYSLFAILGWEHLRTMEIVEKWSPSFILTYVADTIKEWASSFGRWVATIVSRIWEFICFKKFFITIGNLLESTFKLIIAPFFFVVEYVRTCSDSTKQWTGFVSFVAFYYWFWNHVMTYSMVFAEMEETPRLQLSLFGYDFNEEYLAAFRELFYIISFVMFFVGMFWYLYTAGEAVKKIDGQPPVVAPPQPPPPVARARRAKPVE